MKLYLNQKLGVPMQITDEMVTRALEAHDKVTGARQGPYAEHDRRPIEINAMRSALEAAFLNQQLRSK